MELSVQTCPHVNEPILLVADCPLLAAKRERLRLKLLLAEQKRQEANRLKQIEDSIVFAKRLQLCLCAPFDAFTLRLRREQDALIEALKFQRYHFMEMEKAHGTIGSNLPAL